MLTLNNFDLCTTPTFGAPSVRSSLSATQTAAFHTLLSAVFFLTGEQGKNDFMLSIYQSISIIKMVWIQSVQWCTVIYSKDKDNTWICHSFLRKSPHHHTFPAILFLPETEPPGHFEPNVSNIVCVLVWYRKQTSLAGSNHPKNMEYSSCSIKQLELLKQLVIWWQKKNTHMFGIDISFLASPSRSDILFSAGATRLSQTKQEDHEMLEWAVLKRQSPDSIPSGNLT